MRLAELAAISAAVGATRSRNEKVRLLAAAVDTLDDDELDAGLAFLTGAPRQDRLEVGWAALREVRVPELTVADVDGVFEALAAASGEGSRGDRLDLLDALLRRATAEEQDLIAALVLRDLRQGALEGVVVKAIAEAVGVGEEAVRRAVMLRADLGEVVRAARAGGAGALADFRLELFRPLQPMLAQPSGSIDEIDSPTVVDVKLDGARVQVHRSGDDVRVYTRNLRDITARVPEIVEAAAGLSAGSIVLDGEAIALRPDGRPHPFQVTMSRFGSDGGTDPELAEEPLTVSFFDLLHLDGRDLIDGFLRETLDAGHEGIMLKDPDAPYEAGRRGAGWRKIKPVHTLDLVILAAEWGSGRRQGWLSNLHLGARDPDTGSMVMLGKTFKGLTDGMLEWQTAALLEREVRRSGRVVHVRPDLVVEVAFDGVQASSRYPGGMALRFARVKGHRPDKDADEADTIETVRGIHEGRIRPAV